MPLSARQRKVLERYKQFKEEPPDVWRLMAMSVVNHALLIMVIGAIVGIGLAMNFVLGAVFFMGMGFGALCRDMGLFRMTAILWPAIRTVIDWQKVDQVLAGEIEVETSATHQ